MSEVCQIIVEIGGYRLAWIGFAEQGEAQTVRPVAQAGYEAGYLDTLNITWADTERGRGPTGTAIRTGKPNVTRNILTNPDYAPWRAEATRRGYASSIALPLLAGKQALGALNIYAAEPDALDTKEIELLIELAGDLAYGITALRVKAKRRQAEEALRESEERYRSLFDGVPVGLYRTTPGGQFVDANLAFVKRLGYPNREALLAVNATELYVDPEDRVRWQTLMESEGIVHDFETRQYQHDGTVIWVRNSAQAVRGDEGQVLYYEGSLEDITERRRLEEQLRQA